MLVVGLALIGGGIAIALWNKPHENIANASAESTLEAKALFDAYNADEQGANAQYLGKTIAVSGVVKEVSKPDGAPVKVSLETGDDFSVVCELDALSQHARQEFTPGEKIIFKGKCDGFNLDVQLSRCIEVKQ